MLDSNFERHPPIISHEEAELLLDSNTECLILDNDNGDILVLMPISEPVKYLSIDDYEVPIEQQEQSSCQYQVTRNSCQLAFFKPYFVAS